MLGIIIGSVCLVALIWTLARRPHYRRFGWGMAPLHYVFDELGTSAGQEKAIREAFHGVADGAKAYREQWKLSRRDIAAALRNEAFDEQALDMALTRHDEDLVKARREGVGLLARLHSVLDTEQRNKLARLVESGFGHFGRHRYGC